MRDLVNRNKQIKKFKLYYIKCEMQNSNTKIHIAKKNNHLASKK